MGDLGTPHAIILIPTDKRKYNIIIIGMSVYLLLCNDNVVANYFEIYFNN